MKFMSIIAVLIATASGAFAGPSDDARRGFQAQMDAWNRGDLSGAMDVYLNSPQMLFVNKGGVERGLREFDASMRAEFGGRSEKMGKFSGEVLEARDLGPNHALLVVRWSIVHENKRLFGGISTQIGAREGERWRIAVEHAS